MQICLHQSVTDRDVNLTGLRLLCWALSWQTQRDPTTVSSAAEQVFYFIRKYILLTALCEVTKKRTLTKVFAFFFFYETSLLMMQFSETPF